MLTQHRPDIRQAQRIRDWSQEGRPFGGIAQHATAAQTGRQQGQLCLWQVPGEHPPFRGITKLPASCPAQHLVTGLHHGPQGWLLPCVRCQPYHHLLRSRPATAARTEVERKPPPSLTVLVWVWW